MKAILRWIALGLGLGLFGWFAANADLGEIFRTVTELGWLAPVLLLPYGLVYLLDTLGWRCAFATKLDPPVSFLRMIRIRWAGETVNQVIPSAYIGGEAVKVYLLRKRGVPATIGTASVVVGKTAQTFSQVLFLAFGALCLVLVSVPSIGVYQTLVLILGVSVAGIAALVWIQGRGFFALAFGCLDRWPAGSAWLSNKLGPHRKKLERFDEEIRSFYREHRRHLILSAAAYFGGWLAGVLEILAFGAILGLGLRWPEAVAVEAFAGVAKVFAIFIPGALGVQETGIVFVCRLVGFSEPFGIAYAIVRRGREVVFALIGWAFLYLDEAHPRRIAPALDLNSDSK